MFSCNRRTMAWVCWLILISIPLISSASIGQALTKKDASTMTVNFDLNNAYKKKTTTFIHCFCNLPECGKHMNCATHKGCFSELQPILPDDDYVDASSTTTEMTTYGHSNDGFNDTYGCLDMLSVSKTCDQILKSMEAEGSEIPILKHATAQSDVVRAYRCCQEDMCNDQSRTAASARTIQEALVTVIKNSMSQLKEEQPVVVAASSEPSSSSHSDAMDNAINGAKTAQTEVVPDNSTASIKPTTADLPSSEAPSATNSPATDIVATTADLVDNENATPAPVIMDIVDCDSMNNSGDVVIVSHDSTVAVSTSTEHVPSTSTVFPDSSTDHSTTEISVAVTTVGSSGNVIDTTQSITTTTTTIFGSSENITEATKSTTTVGSSENNTETTQSTTTIATTTAAAVDDFITGNGLTKNLTSETTVPVVITETSTTEIATTTKGSAEQKTPIANASDVANVILTHDKVAKLNETSSIDSAVAPQDDAVKLENTPHVFAAKDEVTADNNSVNQDHNHVESSALINQMSRPLPVDARNNWSFLYLFFDLSGVYAFVAVCIAIVVIVAMVKILRKFNIFKKNKGLCISPGELCACGKTSAETAATAPKVVDTCARCINASKYAYIAIPELPSGLVVRH